MGIFWHFTNFSRNRKLQFSPWNFKETSCAINLKGICCNFPFFDFWISESWISIGFRSSVGSHGKWCLYDACMGAESAPEWCDLDQDRIWPYSGRTTKWGAAKPAMKPLGFALIHQRLISTRGYCGDNDKPSKTLLGGPVDGRRRWWQLHG